MVIIASLREQVYQYLRDQMHLGNILPGSSLNLNQISQQLGISKTPLRDALIQMESEGFVTILPRRGVVVNALTLQDIKSFHEIIGALEGFAVQAVFDRLSASHTTRMEELNTEMVSALNREDFNGYYDLNLKFHDVFLELSDNVALQKIILPMKQRLYDFPRRLYIKEWEMSNCDEHRLIIDAVRQGDRNEAVHLLRDVHWSFEVQEKYIRQFYSSARKMIKAGLAQQKAVGSI